MACGAGILLALGIFMSDAIRALPGGADEVRRVLPAAFNWPVFGVALLLMAAPLAGACRGCRRILRSARPVISSAPPV